jgi:hypothetical protein
LPAISLRHFVRKQIDGNLFFTDQKRQEYRRRVESLTPVSLRQWGTMEVDQTLHHPEDPKSRPQVQETMLGPQVLDSTRFPEIRFEAAKIEAKGENHWTVRGNLTLHGQSHPISFDVALADKLYRGTATIKQTDFGITPVTVAGGSVKVKDEVKAEFVIALAR